jgi:uncharacterized membrane protein
VILLVILFIFPNTLSASVGELISTTFVPSSLDLTADFSMDLTADFSMDLTADFSMIPAADSPLSAS